MTTATDTISVLRRFKNAILEGPPGTGKTHVVTDIAAQWSAVTGRPLAGTGHGKFAITFHPSTTYEEFIEGLKYDDADGKFRRCDGFLINIITEAKRYPAQDYLVLLDELNRANVPKVLGDVLLCMEVTKRTSHNGSAWDGGMTVTLPYSGSPFNIPDNVYLLGTMNTSDRSIAPLDSALRRRFGFVRVDPMVGAELIAKIEETDGEKAAVRMASSVQIVTALNAALRDCLGPDATLGHSYFFGVEPQDNNRSSTDDPLAAIREKASNAGAGNVLWLEATAARSGGAASQLNVPNTGEHSLREAFYPMRSGETVTAQPPPHMSDEVSYLDIRVNGHTFKRNTLKFSPGGPNYKIGFSGLNAAAQNINNGIARDYILDKIHVFIRQQDDTFEMVSLPRDDATRTALRAVSVQPNGWHMSTGGTNGREYGIVDLGALDATEAAHERSADDDAVWMTWRYAVLPQLVDTVTQLGVPDLLDPTTRGEALAHLGKPELADRFEAVDQWLGRMGLFLGIEGHGLSRALVISGAPVRDLLVDESNEDDATAPELEPGDDVRDD